jgi:hypothetical protein
VAFRPSGRARPLGSRRSVATSSRIFSTLTVAGSRSPPRIADELEAAGFYGLLLKARDRAIHGPSRVAAIIAEANRATKELERRDKLTPELQQLVRQVKERAARYRWQKKMDEADVAEAGGNAKKAAKLRAEAGAMLAQDWPRAFPAEPIPTT